MSTTFPGTTIEVLELKKSSSRQLFDGIFATGGLTLSQVSLMTGLEPYLIQNWVKRGFVGSPKKRVYSRNQFSRIVIINMLREALQIEKICDLIHVISGVIVDDESDDLISADELYHTYVDLLAESRIDLSDKTAVLAAADVAASEYSINDTEAQKRISKILQIMLYAHAASQLRKKADEIFSTLDQIYHK